MKVLIWVYLILVCFKVQNESFHRCVWLKLGILFSLSIFALFAKTIWNRVIGFMAILTVFTKLKYTPIFQISCLCKHGFRIYIIKFERIKFWIIVLMLLYSFALVDQEYEVLLSFYPKHQQV